MDVDQDFFSHPGAAWLIFTNTSQLTLFATQKGRRNEWIGVIPTAQEEKDAEEKYTHSHTHTQTHTHTRTHTLSFLWLEDALGNRWLAPSSFISYDAHSQGILRACLSQLQRRSHYWAHRWSPDDSIPGSSHHGLFLPRTPSPPSAVSPTWQMLHRAVGGLEWWEQELKKWCVRCGREAGVPCLPVPQSRALQERFRNKLAC